MRLRYDERANALYVYLTFQAEEIPPGGIKYTVTATPDINLDFNHSGHLVGIEVLDAARNVPGLIAEALGRAHPN